MSYEILKAIVDSSKGTLFAGIDTKTDVKLKGGKSNPFQSRVTKITEGSSVILFNGTDQNGYENMIKKRLVEEGKDPDSFTLGERAWGKRIDRSPFIDHNGKLYLEMIFQKNGNSTYYVDGVKTDKSEIEGLQETAINEDSQGGLDSKVIVRTYAVDSIVGFRANGVQIVFQR